MAQKIESIDRKNILWIAFINGIILKEITTNQDG